MAAAAGVRAAVLAPVAGRPMLGWVLDTLRAATCVGGGVIVGDETLLEGNSDLVRSVQAAGYRVVPGRAGPSASALAAVAGLQHWPCLITTGDHPLLTAATVEEFCAAALRADVDLAVGVVRHSAVQARLPATRRTAIRFSDGAICGCNLFAVCTAQGMGALALWQRVEAQRKRPWRVIRLLGLRALAAYLTGRLTSSAALQRLSQLAGCRIGFVYLSAPEMAVDVDTPADWHLVERLLTERLAAQHPTMTPASPC